jgi:hypothetical protein
VAVVVPNAFIGRPRASAGRRAVHDGRDAAQPDHQHNDTGATTGFLLAARGAPASRRMRRIASIATRTPGDTDGRHAATAPASRLATAAEDEHLQQPGDPAHVAAVAQPREALPFRLDGPRQASGARGRAASRPPTVKVPARRQSPDTRPATAQQQRAPLLLSIDCSASGKWRIVRVRLRRGYQSAAVSKSLGDSTRRRRTDERVRVRQTFSAILWSHADSARAGRRAAVRGTR